VTWVVLIASRDGFFNPLKPNSQDYTIPMPEAINFVDGRRQKGRGLPI
jgi:hypothetical protein